MRRLFRLWNSISWLIFITALISLFWFAEKPTLENTSAILFYFGSRFILSLLVYIGSNLIQEMDESHIYRNMLVNIIDEESLRREELPDEFELLAANAVLAFDLAWARDFLLRSPLLYSRFLNYEQEIKDLRDSYYDFVHRYTYTLLRALRAYNPEVTMPFIEAYADAVDQFFNELQSIVNQPVFRLSTRRRHIINAFFKFYDTMLLELARMEDRFYG